MDLNPIILSIPVFFLLIAIELGYDLIAKKGIYRSGDAFSNIGCGIFEQVTGIFAKVLTVGLFTIVFENFRIMTIPVNWWTSVILFIGVDFFYYWAHRKSHEINLFWIGHVIHHQSEDYNLSVALRQGALQKFFTAPFYLPLALLGFDPYAFLFASAFNTLYQFWIHTESIGKLGWFEWVFNTPSHHRVHHGRDPKYIDRNHAGTLIIWDRMFGTFQEEQERPHYGITKPTNTWNPVKAHIIPIFQLWDEVKRGRSLMDRLRITFGPPGWLPEYAGGFQKPRPVNEVTFKKYNAKAPSWIRWYGILQFIILLMFTSWFLFSFGNLGTAEKVAASLLILISLIGIGNLFEGGKRIGFWELIRLTTCLVVWPGISQTTIGLGIGLGGILGSIALFAILLAQLPKWSHLEVK